MKHVFVFTIIGSWCNAPNCDKYDRNTAPTIFHSNSHNCKCIIILLRFVFDSHIKLLTYNIVVFLFKIYLFIYFGHWVQF